MKRKKGGLALLIILVLFSLHCMIYGLLEYAYDEPCFLQGKLERLTMPSVTDLPESTDRYIVDRYVRDVILPAERFFLYGSEFSRCNDSGYSAMKLFLNGFSFVFLIIAIVRSLSGIARICVAIVLATALCALAHFLIRKIYNNYFALRQFKIGVEELREIFSRCKSEFPIIDEKRAFNNFVILQYSEYYSEIAWPVQKRKALLSFLDKASAVVYFFLFWGTHGE